MTSPARQRQRSPVDYAPEGRRLPHTWWFRGPLALAAVASVIFVLRVPDERTPWWGISGSLLDVSVYRWGAEAVAAGIPLYEGLLTGQDPGRGFSGMPFTYPPFAALLMQPLRLVSLSLMEALWTAMTLILLYLVIRMCLRTLSYRNERVTKQVAFCLAAIALCLEPVRTTLWLGQINIVLLALVVGDHLLFRLREEARAGGSSSPPLRWWHRLAGAGSGIAAGIKLTPAFFWAHWILTGRWLMAAASIGAFALSAGIGFALLPSDSLRYWSGTMFESQRIEQDLAPSNQSVRGVLARIIDADMAPTAVWLVAAVAIALIGLGVAALAHRAGAQLLALTLAGMTMTMVSPFSWGHHWVWFVPLLVLAMHFALEATRRLPRPAGVAAWLLPILVVAGAGAWVQNFPNPDYPDDRWVAIGNFMHVYDSVPLLTAAVQNIYPLMWVGVLVATTVIVVQSGPRVWGSRRPAR